MSRILSRGGGNPACLAGGIPACLAGFQVHTQGGAWGVWPGRGCLQAHTWGGVSRPTPQAHTHGGLQAHTQGGVSQHALRQTPSSRGLLLRAVRILLECILLQRCFYFSFFYFNSFIIGVIRISGIRFAIAVVLIPAVIFFSVNGPSDDISYLRVRWPRDCDVSLCRIIGREQNQPGWCRTLLRGQWWDHAAGKPSWSPYPCCQEHLLADENFQILIQHGIRH